MKKVAIVGAGISGLYLGNIFNNYPEIDYKIFEKKDNLEISESYGIQLSINSIKLLNKIGFKNLPVSDVFFPEKIDFFQSKNLNKICEINLKQFNDNENRYTTLKRSSLIKILLKNIPNEKVILNKSFIKLNLIDNYKVYFSENYHENFDYLILSDGVFSRSRSVITGKNYEPFYNGSIALRGEIKDNNIKNISVYMGSNFHYVMYPVNQKGEVNFVAIIKNRLSKENLENKELLKSKLFLESLSNILQSHSDLDTSSIKNLKAFPVFVSNKATVSKKKNIFFCGDALFSFPPSFAQGASQSIETSDDIANCILKNSKLNYSARLKRINSINQRSKLNHFAFQLSNPLLQFLRNLILKYLSKNKKFLEYYLGKIYRY